MKRFIFLIPITIALLVLTSIVAAQSSPSIRVQSTAPTSNVIAPLAGSIVSTTFTYQGLIKQSGSPINGNCDLAFRLFDAASSGAQIDSPITRTLPITNGLFTVGLNFGEGSVFSGDARWLEIQVRCPTNIGSFTPLNPRQALTPAPLALALPGFRTEPNAISPNIVGGHISNTIGGGSDASAILSGGSITYPNSISGGEGNVIAGGNLNGIVGSVSAFIGGGFSNTIHSRTGVIAGGDSNIVLGNDAAIAGGYRNQAIGDRSFVGGGLGNIAYGPYSTIPGGDQNQAFGYYSLAAGLGARAVGNGTFVWADSVGMPITSTANDQFIVRAAGGVGIGTNAPENQLHVIENIADTGYPANHVMQIENTSTAYGGDVLALTINFTQAATSGNNFITFFTTTNTSIGSIEGNGSGGVVMSGPGSDYAEYLPRADVNEVLKPGDIVGVNSGQVSRITRGASQVLVVSNGPIVAGNDPGENARANYERVVFIGQVDAKVRGAVQAGDFIVPSGLEDGTGIAVSPEAITADQFVQVVGQAWESSPDVNLRSVRVAIGLTRSNPFVKTLLDQNQQQADRITALEARLANTDQSASPAPFNVFNLISVIALIAVVAMWRQQRKHQGGHQ